MADKDSIELAGNKDQCGHCEEGDKFFHKIAQANPNVIYQYHHEGSPGDQEIRQGVDFFPRIRHCKINEKGEKVSCRMIDGFDPSQWAFLGSGMPGAGDMMKTDLDLDSAIDI